MVEVKQKKSKGKKKIQKGGGVLFKDQFGNGFNTDQIDKVSKNFEEELKTDFAKLLLIQYWDPVKETLSVHLNNNTRTKLIEKKKEGLEHDPEDFLSYITSTKYSNDKWWWEFLKEDYTSDEYNMFIWWHDDNNFDSLDLIPYRDDNSVISAVNNFTFSLWAHEGVELNVSDIVVTIDENLSDLQPVTPMFSTARMLEEFNRFEQHKQQQQQQLQQQPQQQQLQQQPQQQLQQQHQQQQQQQSSSKAAAK